MKPLTERMSKMYKPLYQKVTYDIAGNPEEPELERILRRAIDKITFSGWQMPDKSLTEKTYRRAHLKYRPCYDCHQKVTWSDVCAVRAFPWEQMPEIEVTEKKTGNKMKVRYFNLMVLCPDCATKDSICSAPRSPNEAIAFQTQKTDEWKMIEAEAKAIEERTLADEKAFAEELKQQKQRLERRVANYKRETLEMERAYQDLDYRKKEAAKKSDRLQVEIEEDKVKLASLQEEYDREHQKLEELIRKQQKVKEMTDKVLLETRELREKRRTQTIEALEMLGDTCEQLRTQHQEAMSKALAEFQKSLTVAQKTVEQTVASSNDGICLTLKGIVAECDDVKDKMSGDKECAICYERISEYIRLDPCGHAFCGDCASQIHSCSICGAGITKKQPIKFP